MNELLKAAVLAHGGLERWNKVKTVNVAGTIETKRERLGMDFPSQDKRSLFEPDRVEGHRRDTPWDDIPHTNVLRRNVALQCPVQGIWHSRFSAWEATTWRELCS
jgi:hypothetical protein